MKHSLVFFGYAVASLGLAFIAVIFYVTYCLPDCVKSADSVAKKRVDRQVVFTGKHNVERSYSVNRSQEDIPGRKQEFKISYPDKDKTGKNDSLAPFDKKQRFPGTEIISLPGSNSKPVAAE